MSTDKMAAYLRRVTVFIFLIALVILDCTNSAELRRAGNFRYPEDNGNRRNLDAIHLGLPSKTSNIVPGQHVPSIPRKSNPQVPQSPNRDGNPSAYKPTPIKIADHPHCQKDVQTLCSGGTGQLTNNFAVLDCLQKRDQDSSVSKMCQHLVWTYKRNLTRDIRFDSAAQEVCRNVISQLPECARLKHGTGELISCLIENQDNVTSNPNCHQFLKQMASIVFSDYRLINKFTDHCAGDINKLRCGRFHVDDDDGAPHSQGKTVECLSEHVKELAAECKTQILRIAELQADDFHLDRPLFYACREDRERFCKRTNAGKGRIYKCLFRHKFEREMSEECRGRLVRRQRLIQEDYKADKRLAVECRHDIHEFGCKKNGPKSKFAKLSHILLCLEGNLKEGKKVRGECLAEMEAWRQSLLEDYKITPDLVVGCSDEIHKHCSKQLERDGKTLHCLMELAKPVHKDQIMIKRISDKCSAQLQALLLAADPFDDYRMDPTLQESCQHVVDKACSGVKPGEGRVLECLMEKVGTPFMTDECEERLMEIQYFASRNFKMDPRLYRFCHEDAKAKCHAPEHWYDPNVQTVEAGPIVFQCLYSYYKRYPDDKDKQLSRACAFEVKRIMRQRAISIDLEPRIEEPCLPDLGKFCSEKIRKGEEIHCLQDNMEKLQQNCKWAIGNFTQDEDEDPQLDRILMRACTPMIKRFCEDLLENEDTEPGDVMECLIKYKHHVDMNRKCQCGIEHHQLITMKNYRLSYKFKESCKKDVVQYCKNIKIKSKAEVVHCLSEVKRNDTLLDKEQRLSKPCRRQLRFEVLSRNENLDLDENLKKDCRQDYHKFCKNITPGKAKAIECLRKHRKSLSRKCHFRIFQREREQAEDNALDYTFMKVCKNMINIHCPEVDPKETMNCLKNYKEDFDFDSKCKTLLKERQEEQAEDVSLNPVLAKACKRDIPKFCSVELKKNPNHNRETFHGRIINCLKVQFADKRLSRDCEDHIRIVIHEAASDYKQDSVLEDACVNEVKVCVNKGFQGEQIVECLKEMLVKGEMGRNKNCTKEVARLIQEGHADVYVDPLLHRACALDIAHYCMHVPPGEGRQMSCLLAALDDPKVKLKPDCGKMLSERKEMWEYAARVAPAESFQEIMNQVTTSPAKHYFLGVIFSVIGCIFVIGIMCGRVTKRIKHINKNK